MSWTERSELIMALHVYEWKLRTGITRTPGFEHKKLASYAVNIGLKCGHDCSYCSTGAMNRCHKAFKELGLNPFERGYAIVDPTTPEWVARDARRIRKRGMVQLCTTVDAWSPEAQKFALGRRCLKAILSEPGWTVRILTKNAAVVQDYDLTAEYANRVLLGLSITSTPDKSEVVAAIEPNASPITERVAALRKARALGLRTYAMLCPLLPGIADTQSQIDGLVRLAVEYGAEEIFAEPVNARASCLQATQETLQQRDYNAEAAAVATIRHKTGWSSYVVQLISNIQRSVRAQYDIDRLRFLLYPSRLTPGDEAQIRRDDAGVVWLGTV